MKTQFANGREKLNNSDWKIEVLENQGSLSAFEGHFCLFAENQYGQNIPIISDLISVNDNDAVKITIYSSACLSGEFWTNYIIGVNSNNDLESFIRIAKISKPTDDTNVELILSVDEQILEHHVLDDFTFIKSHEYNGKIVFVEHLQSFYEFNENVFYSEYNIDFIEGNNGTWIKVNNALCNIEDLSGKGGSRRNIDNISKMPNNKILEYELNGDSPELFFYLESENNEQLNKNRLISIKSLINNTNISNYLENLITYTIQGFVGSDYLLRKTDHLTGEILEELGTEIIYNNENPIRLPDAIQTNEKLLISVKLNFTNDEINSSITNGSDFSINFVLIPNAKRKNPLGFLLGGNFVINTGERLRVYPYDEDEILIKSGKAVINNFDVNKSNNVILRTLPNNTDNIKILVDQDGVISWSKNYSKIKPTRAIVSTKKHESYISSFTTTTININTKHKLNFQVNLEKTEDNLKQLNPSFPDVISENREWWEFSVTAINLYLRIRQYDNGKIVNEEFWKNENLNALNSINDFEFIRLNNFELISKSELPTENYSLFDPGKIQNLRLINASNFNNVFTENLKDIYNSDEIELGLAFSLVYDGSVISNISHDPKNGAMSEINGKILDQVKSKIYYKDPIDFKELSKLSKYNLQNGMEIKVRLENGDYESYVYYESSSNVDLEDVQPYNAFPNETCKWAKLNKNQSPTNNLNNEIKKEIFKNSIIFG